MGLVMFFLFHPGVNITVLKTVSPIKKPALSKPVFFILTNNTLYRLIRNENSPKPIIKTADWYFNYQVHN